MANVNECIYGNCPALNLNQMFVEATTKIGMRPAQEDRVLICPHMGCRQTTLCGVFDGTVGDAASEYVNRHIVNNIKTDSCDFLSRPSRGDEPENEMADRKNKVSEMLRHSFLHTDSEFIQYCTQNGKLDYASSTGVVTLLWAHNMLSIAHLGDSRGCLAKVHRDSGGKDAIQPEWLTVDHKPDQPEELRRIQEAGGSLVYLHGNKPFIRGGDFLQRQQLAQHPKQLNYSRAFGGKDLKMYGLSADPTISHRKLIPHEDKFVLLASDGLWDTLPLKTICEVAYSAYLEYKLHPYQGGEVGMITSRVVEAALQQMPLTTVRDNISCVGIFFEWEGQAQAPMAHVIPVKLPGGESNN